MFVANSYKNTEVGHPFGYLKASTTLSCVNLFVMPYNYPVLLPLLDELFKVSVCLQKKLVLTVCVIDRYIGGNRPKNGERHFKITLEHSQRITLDLYEEL